MAAVVALIFTSGSRFPISKLHKSAKKKKNTFHFHSSNLKCWANMTTHHLHWESFLLHKICLHAHTGTCSDSKLNMYGQHLDKLLVVFFVCLFSIEPYKGLTEQQANERMRSKHGRKALWFCRPKPKTVCRKSTNRSSTKWSQNPSLFFSPPRVW